VRSARLASLVLAVQL